MEGSVIDSTKGAVGSFKQAAKNTAISKNGLSDSYTRHGWAKLLPFLPPRPIVSG